MLKNIQKKDRSCHHYIIVEILYITRTNYNTRTKLVLFSFYCPYNKRWICAKVGIIYKNKKNIDKYLFMFIISIICWIKSAIYFYKKYGWGGKGHWYLKNKCFHYTFFNVSDIFLFFCTMPFSFACSAFNYHFHVGQ